MTRGPVTNDGNGTSVVIPVIIACTVLWAVWNLYDVPFWIVAFIGLTIVFCVGVFTGVTIAIESPKVGEWIHDRVLGRRD